MYNYIYCIKTIQCTGMSLSREQFCLLSRNWQNNLIKIVMRVILSDIPVYCCFKSTGNFKIHVVKGIFTRGVFSLEIQAYLTWICLFIVLYIMLYSVQVVINLSRMLIFIISGEIHM